MRPAATRIGRDALDDVDLEATDLGANETGSLESIGTGTATDVLDARQPVELAHDILADGSPAAEHHDVMDVEAAKLGCHLAVQGGAVGQQQRGVDLLGERGARQGVRIGVGAGDERDPGGAAGTGLL